MPIRFGSLVAGSIIQSHLLALSEVQATFQTVRYGVVVPQAQQTPAILHHLQSGVYDSPLSGPPNSESMNYAVRFLCTGGSPAPVKAAADQAWEHFALIRAIDLPDSMQLTIQLSNEYPQPEIFEGGQLYDQLGFVLALTLTQGG